MWLPVNSLYATENFNSTQTGGYTYSSFSGQNNIGGVVSLRNIATGNNVLIPAGEPWPAIAWNQRYDFNTLWSAYSGNFSTTGQPPVQNVSYGTVAFLGESSIYQTDIYDTISGFVVECSFLINTLTGSVSTGQNFYGVYFEHTGEGYDSVSLSSDPPGFVVGKGLSHETFVPATGINTQVIGFRYGVKGETGQFITTDGTRLLITGRSPGTSLSGTITGAGFPEYESITILGDITLDGRADSDARVELGRYNWKSPATDIAGDFIADTEYSTVPLTFYTRTFRPTIPVGEVASYYVNLVGETGGVTVVSIEYSDNNFDSVSTITDSYVSGSATGLMSTGANLSMPDGREVRFKIEQWSNDGLLPPPAVDYITVTNTSQDQAGLVTIDPVIGTAAGEFPLLISIDPDNQDRFKNPTGGIFNVCLNQQQSLREKISGLTGTNTRGNLEGVSGVFGDPSWSFFGYTGYIGTYESRIFRSGPNLSNANLLSTSDRAAIFVTGNLTGAPIGYTGYAINKWTLPGSTTGGAYLTETIAYPDESGNVRDWHAQHFRGTVGNGFVTNPVTGSSTDENVVVEAIIQVLNGGVAFTIDSGDTANTTPVYLSARYDQPQKVRTVLPRNSVGSFTINVYGTDEVGDYTGTGQCEWSVGALRVYGMADGGPTQWNSVAWQNIAPRTNEGDDWGDMSYAIDFWVKDRGLINNTGEEKDSYLVATTGVSEIYIGTDKFGRPKVSAYDTGSFAFTRTGAFGLDTQQWHHISFQYNYRDFNYLYVDGELALAFTGDIRETELKHVSIAKNHVCSISNLRITEGYKHPAQISAFDALSTPPRFQSEFQYPSGQAHFLYRFDEGTNFDAAGNADVIFPEAQNNRKNIVYNVGVHGEGMTFHNGAYGYSITGAYATGDMFFAGYVALPAPVTKSTIASGDNWSIWFSGQHLNFTYSGTTLSSTPEFNQFMYFPFVVDMYTNGGNTYAVGSYYTGSATETMFSGQVSSSDVLHVYGTNHIGHNPSDENDRGQFYIDEFGLFSGRYTGETGNWLMWDVRKDQPGETVYINGTALDTSRVRHISVYDKEIVVPPQTNFTNTGSILTFSVDSLAGKLFARPNFQYGGARKIVLDTGSYELWAETRDKICKTKSPFRVGREVPREGINLAFIQSPEFSVPNNLSMVDNIGNISENFVSSLKSYDIHGITNDTGSSFFTLTGEIDTDEVLVTTYSMVREDFVGAPLFYQHKLGGEELYLYQVDATGNSVTAADINLIRENIQILNQDGGPVRIEEFPWDVRVSKIRSDSFQLPSNVYNVELLSRDKYIPGKSLFVKFNAANPSNQFTQVKGWMECLNPQPIWVKTKDQLSIPETFQTTYAGNFDHIGTQNYNIGPELSLKTPGTGDWSPAYHRDLTRDKTV